MCCTDNRAFFFLNHCLGKLYTFSLMYCIGQYGKVYKGEYRRLDRPKYFVAIKTIRQHESEKEKEQFLTEMRVMSNMIHPNIVRLFGLVQQGIPGMQ